MKHLDELIFFLFPSSQDHIYNQDGTSYGDVIPFRRIFEHPDFAYTAYNDIAVIELGKRVEYDIETRGEEPTCLGRKKEVTETLNFKTNKGNMLGLVNLKKCQFFQEKGSEKTVSLKIREFDAMTNRKNLFNYK